MKFRTPFFIFVSLNLCIVFDENNYGEIRSNLTDLVWKLCAVEVNKCTVYYMSGIDNIK